MMQRTPPTPPRFLRALVLFVTVVVGLGACGAGGGGGDHRSASSSEGSLEELAARLAEDLADDGVARLADPSFSDRWGLTTGAGSHLVVNGMMRPEGRRRSVDERGRGIALNDGEGFVLDLRSGRWRPMPPQPFSAPLEMSTRVVVWTGREVVFVGTPCEAVFLDEEFLEEVGFDGPDDPPVCTKGDDRVRAAAFAAGVGRWRPLPDPPLPEVERARSRWPVATGLSRVGWTGRHVVILPWDPRFGGRLLLFDPGPGRWWWSAPIPMEVRAGELCIAGGRVIGRTGGEAVLAPGEEADRRVGIFGLDEGTGAWEELVTFDRADTELSTQGLSCPWDGRADAVIVESPPIGDLRPPRIVRLQVSQGRAESLPEVPAEAVEASLSLAGVRVGDDDDEVYVVGDRSDIIPGGPAMRGGIWVPRSDGSGWEQAPPFAGRYFGALVYLGEGRFVVQGRNWLPPPSPADAPEHGLLVDLSAYLERHGIDLSANDGGRLKH
jgi:hypothetical protein